MQTTIEGKPADMSLIYQKTSRTYRWKSPSSKPANAACLIDQLAMVCGVTKSEAVYEAVKLASVFVNIAGPEALAAISSIDSVQLEMIVSTMQRAIGSEGACDADAGLKEKEVLKLTGEEQGC